MRPFFALLMICSSLLPVSAKLKLDRFPYLQQVTPTSIVLRWRSDDPSPSIVHYGKKFKKQNSKVSDMLEKEEHEILIEGLLPNTRYFYSIYGMSKDKKRLLVGEAREYFFKTSPELGSEQAMRFWLLADAGVASIKDSKRSVKKIQKNVRDSFYNAYDGKADLFFMLGDNAYQRGKDKEFQEAVFEIYDEALSHTPLFTAFGNHDQGLDGSTGEFMSESFPQARGVYYDTFTLPAKAEAGGVASGTEAYYSLDYGNVHFVILDSTDSIWIDLSEEEKVSCYKSKTQAKCKRESWSPDTDKPNSMMNWLQSDLEATKQDWIVALFHHPPYTQKRDLKGRNDNSVWVRQNLLPLLESYGTDLVVSGDVHRYYRTHMLYGHFGMNPLFTKSMIYSKGEKAEVEIKKAKPRLKHRIYKKILFTERDAKEATMPPGTIYVVAGTAGRPDKDDDFEYHSSSAVHHNIAGSVILEVEAKRLNLKFLSADEEILDNFTIIKSPNEFKL